MLLLLSIAIDTKEFYAAGYKPPTRSTDLSYNVPAGVSQADGSHVTKPKSFDFGAGNWSQFASGPFGGGKGPFG